MADSVENVRFTDDEVREILRSASEDQPPNAVIETGGLSLEDLQAAAAEVGIGPARVAESARAIVRRRSLRTSRVLGVPRALYLERHVPGEISEDASADVLAAVRGRFGQVGEAKELHGSLDWSAKSEVGERHVTVTSRDGQTTVRGSSNLTGLAVITYLPAGLLGTVVSAIMFSTAANAANPIGMVVALALLPTLYVILRTVLGRVGRAETERLEQAIEDIALIAENESATDETRASDAPE